MQKRSSKKKRQPDYQQLARKVLDVVAPDAEPKAIKPAKKPATPKRKLDAEPTPNATTTGDGKNPAAVALGKLGGKIGGPARAAKLSKARRSEIAQKAAAARWKPKKRAKSK